MLVSACAPPAVLCVFLEVLIARSRSGICVVVALLGLEGECVVDTNGLAVLPATTVA